MGDKPVPVDRGDHLVVYQPLAADLRQAWRSPRLDARVADFRRAGTELASNVIAIFLLKELRGRAELAPYPRLRALLNRLDGTEAVADSTSWRFTDPRTRTRMRLTDVS